MKKCLLVLLAFVLCSTAAFAEGIDIKTMTDEELIALFQEVQVELAERVGLTAVNRIGRGSYVVGQDIKAGYYDFVCLDTDCWDDGTPDNNIYIYLLIGDTAADLGDRIYWEQGFAVGTHVTFNLEEGTLLRLDGCSGELTEISPSWVP